MKTRWPIVLVTVVSLGTLGLTGCSEDDGCQGETYDADLGAQGSPTPIEALDAWLDERSGPTPPDDSWVQQDPGESSADEVVLTNDDGAGWWVSASRTSQDGWVVTSATDDATGCADKLS